MPRRITDSSEWTRDDSDSEKEDQDDREVKKQKGTLSKQFHDLFEGFKWYHQDGLEKIFYFSF